MGGNGNVYMGKLTGMGANGNVYMGKLTGMGGNLWKAWEWD